MPTELERQFHLAMVDLYRRARDEAGYNAIRFLQMVMDHGGLPTAKTLINADTPSDGYAALFLRNRLDLTVEAFAVEHSMWHCLFEPEEIERARERLRKYGYATN